MSHVGFTGSRDGLTPAQHASLAQLLSTLTMASFHHGDCKGADAAAHAMVTTQFPSVPIVVHPPCYVAERAFCVSTVPPRAPQDYLVRNAEIVQETDFLIATPNHMQEQVRSGTWMTIRLARKRHKSVYIILPNGYLKHEKAVQASA